MPRYAIARLYIVEADNAREAWERTTSSLGLVTPHDKPYLALKVTEPEYQSNCFPVTDDMAIDPAWSIPRIEWQDQVLEPIPADQEEDR